MEESAPGRSWASESLGAGFVRYPARCELIWLHGRAVSALLNLDWSIGGMLERLTA